MENQWKWKEPNPLKNAFKNQFKMNENSWNLTRALKSKIWVVGVLSKAFCVCFFLLFFAFLRMVWCHPLDFHENQRSQIRWKMHLKINWKWMKIHGKSMGCFIVGRTMKMCLFFVWFARFGLDGLVSNPLDFHGNFMGICISEMHAKSMEINENEIKIQWKPKEIIRKLMKK